MGWDGDGDGDGDRDGDMWGVVRWGGVGWDG